MIKSTQKKWDTHYASWLITKWWSITIFQAHRSILKVYKRYTEDTLKEYLRYTEGILKIYWKCAISILMVYSRYTDGILKVYWKYTEGLLKIYWRFPEDILKLYLRYTEDIKVVAQYLQQIPTVPTQSVQISVSKSFKNDHKRTL